MTTTPPLDGAKLDFTDDMSYGDYLALDSLLTAQHPLSPDHNEMLFIIQHQTSELWMKLMLHELQAARQQIQQDALPPAFKMLERVARIMAQLVTSWDVLATLTPSEYSAIRPYLKNSSGFQSHQYRLIEFIMGNKQEVMMRPHRHNPPVFEQVDAELNVPSLYDEAVRLLARKGQSINPSVLDRDWSQPYAYDASVEAAWLAIYQQPESQWELYELAEELVDLEDAFRQWRFRHLTTVERVIGYKRGTGGTAGTYYLRHVLDTRLFPELWNVRTHL
ncbi:MAG TPA: tryptophan 2,3-dioxygenase [Aggregatilineales bacterium]|nr:tryptophan 2,3-dioxygenase [Aggregatilineales bacterium]